MKFTSLVIIFAFASSVHAAEQKIVIEVGTMICGADPHNIKNSLSAIIGVKNVEISLLNKTATVTFDNQVSNASAMLVAIAGAGYAGLVKPQ